MNRAVITGLALAGVAGSAGAALAGAAGRVERPTIDGAQPASLIGASEHADRTATYRVGDAGTVTITVHAGAMSASATATGTGWVLVSTAGAGTHVEVQFTDSLQLVTFAADLVGNDITVSLTNVPAPGAPTTTGEPAPITVSIVATLHDQETKSSATAPRAATPVAKEDDERYESTTESTTESATKSVAPTPAATTAPSGSTSASDDHESDDHESDDHGATGYSDDSQEYGDD